MQRKAQGNQSLVPTTTQLLSKQPKNLPICLQQTSFPGAEAQLEQHREKETPQGTPVPPLYYTEAENSGFSPVYLQRKGIQSFKSFHINSARSLGKRPGYRAPSRDQSDKEARANSTLVTPLISSPALWG